MLMKEQQKLCAGGVAGWKKDKGWFLTKLSTPLKWDLLIVALGTYPKEDYDHTEPCI